MTLQLTGSYADQIFVAAPDGCATGTAVRLVAANTPAPTISLADDTGPSTTDRITRDDDLQGTAAANATVTFTEGQTVLGTTTADANGAYAFTPANLPQGQQTVTASETEAGATQSADLTFTYDTASPRLTALAESGPGIDRNGNGDLGAGRTVTLIVTTSEAVVVQGGTPTLTLNDGGVATYAGGSGTAQQQFTYTVQPGQNTAKLAVTAVNANGATVTDAAGNPLGLNLTGASVPSGTLVIDTTAPTYGQDADNGALDRLRGR